MRGKFIALSALICLASCVCFSSEANAKTLIKFAHAGSLSHFYHTGAVYFKEIIEKRSDNISVQIFPQSQLGNEREAIEGVRMGTIEMTSVAASGALPNWVPEMQVFAMPYLLTNRRQAYEVLDGSFGGKLNALIEKKGFKNLAFFEIGFKNFSNNVRPIKRPEDIAGLKIRVMESKVWMDFIKLLGGIPTPIPFGELYSALQQGVVDGQENPVFPLVAMKFHEVQKYATLDRHSYEPVAVLVNPKWFDSLKQEEQTLIAQAVIDTRDFIRKHLEEQESKDIDYLKEQGMVFEEDPDIDAFRAKTAPLIDVIQEMVGEEILKEFLLAVEQAK